MTLTLTDIWASRSGVVRSCNAAQPKTTTAPATNDVSSDSTETDLSREIIRQYNLPSADSELQRLDARSAFPRKRCATKQLSRRHQHNVPWKLPCARKYPAHRTHTGTRQPAPLFGTFLTNRDWLDLRGKDRPSSLFPLDTRNQISPKFVLLLLFSANPLTAVPWLAANTNP